MHPPLRLVLTVLAVCAVIVVLGLLLAPDADAGSTWALEAS